MIIRIAGRATVELHARAFYTAEALGKAEEMHTPFFREIHVNRNSLSTEAQLQAFFAQFGVDAQAFENAFNSFSVNLKMQRADDLAKRYRISSVPTVVINGKYTTDANSAHGGSDKLWGFGGKDTLIGDVDQVVVLVAVVSGRRDGPLELAVHRSIDGELRTCVLGSGAPRPQEIRLRNGWGMLSGGESLMR
mgnify:CR=1 FL=1